MLRKRLRTAGVLWGMAIAVCASVAAQGNNRILQYNQAYENPPDSNDPYYVIDQFQQQVTIRRGIDGETFWFEADVVSGGQVIGHGNINLIQADPNAGPVAITVADYAQGYDRPGAFNIREINLNASGVVGTIEHLKITGLLGEYGPITAHALTGTCDVGASILNPITLDSLAGDIECHAMYADLTVMGPDPLATPTISIWGTYDATMTIGHNVKRIHVGVLSGSISVLDNLTELDVGTGDLTGSVYVGGNLGVDGQRHDIYEVRYSGAISVSGDLYGDMILNREFAGAMHIGGDVTPLALIDAATYWSELSGDITVGGDLLGRIRSGQGLYPDPLSGRIVINGGVFGCDRIMIKGGLEDVVGDTSRGHIIINGSLDAMSPDCAAISITVDPGLPWDTEFIAIDYDGYDSADTWVQGYVAINGTAYDPNNYPAEHIWLITPCRGDMNNDGTTNFSDINAFVDALTDLPDYRLNYPGLEGSMDYHGDANCNGSFGFDDINPFAEMVTWNCCSIDCTPCGGEGVGAGAGGGRLPPEQWAKVLESYVAPESFAGLLDMASVAAAIGETPADKAYWAEVYDLLTE